MSGKSSRRSLLERVNKEVNRSISYRTDKELYGVRDKWVLPERYGDCEDYVLLKRQKLIELWFDPFELRIAICYTELKEGHAVLTVDDGPETYVLDNRFNELKTYRSLVRYGYKFLKRQKGKEWVLIK